MYVNIDRGGDTPRLTLSGRLEDRAARELGQALENLALSRPSTLEVDLFAVVSLNSTVLSTLIGFYRQIPDCAISLLNAPADIYDMLVTVKLDRLFSINRAA